SRRREKTQATVRRASVEDGLRGTEAPASRRGIGARDRAVDRRARQAVKYTSRAMTPLFCLGKHHLQQGFTMKRAWSSKYEKCQECGTQRYSHRAKGLCIRCYQLVYKLKQIEQWDLADPQTLKGLPKVDTFWEEKKIFNQVKRGAA